MVGRTIGKYRVLDRLGSGGMGTVYKAVDATLGREVAIKALNPELTDPAILARFRAEATALGRLNHPAIATIYELVECGHDRLIVMELVQGETLEALVARMGVLVPDEAAFVVDQVLSALAHTHGAGIVHCDIKPANVMVTAHGGVKIMDFGTARVRGRGDARTSLMGTPAYMPPEQLLGREIDGRADLYAVGVLFYRLITGTLPFTAATPIDAMRRQIGDAPTPAIEHRPDLPDWCDYILRRALAKDPADRFQTAEGFREAIRHASGWAASEPRRTFVAPQVEAAATSSGWPAVERVADALVAPATSRSTERLSPRTAMVAALFRRRPAAARRLAPLAAAMSLLTVALLRAPEANLVALPSSPLVAAAPLLPAARTVRLAAEEAGPARPPAVYAFDARVVAGTQDRQQECRCRVLLAPGSLIWRSESDRRLRETVAYDRVASIVYSHGRDPLWNGPGGPAPVVRGSRGPLAVFGFFSDRDWLSLRVTDPNLRFVVLRFDDGAQARSAIMALEERTGRKIERLSKRQS